MESAAISAQQDAMSQLSGAQQSQVKSGDSISIEYRLLQVDTKSAVKIDKLVGKAKRDGEDVLGPLLAQTARGTLAAAIPTNKH
jgi:hypothetical protein